MVAENPKEAIYRVAICNQNGDVVWSYELTQTSGQYEAWIQYQREWFEEH